MRLYEFAIDGSNDCFGQDDTDPTLAVGSIREAKKSLNIMASGCNEWLDENFEPNGTVELRRIDDHRVVATFAPHAKVARRFPDGTTAMKVVWWREER